MIFIPKSSSCSSSLGCYAKAERELREAQRDTKLVHFGRRRDSTNNGLIKAEEGTCIPFHVLKAWRICRRRPAVP